MNPVNNWNIASRNTVNNNVSNLQRMEAVVDNKNITTSILR